MRLIRFFVTAALIGCVWWTTPLGRDQAVARTAGQGRAKLAEALRLNRQVFRLYRQGRYAEAIEPAQKALAIRIKVLGPDHPLVAPSLNNLALIYKKMGAHAKALPLYKRALAIDLKTSGPDSPYVAITLNNLAGLYLSRGEYAKALALYKRALAIFQKAPRPNHPGVANVLNNLAELYRITGAYSRALALYKRVLDIDQKAVGPNHPKVATTLNNLAILYAQMGAFGQALPLHKRALAIRKKALGYNHPEVANSLNNLAKLFGLMGVYSQALPLYERALAILEHSLGPGHPQVAACLDNLAGIYFSIGALAKARHLNARALAINQKAFGPNHPLVAQSLNNLAAIFSRQGAYDKALPLLRRVPAILVKSLGPNHPLVARSVGNLAVIYQSMGAYDKALPLLQKARTILDKGLGHDHPLVATSLNNLATLHVKMGARDKAWPLFRQALAIARKDSGSNHAALITILGNLSWLEASRGRFEKAWQMDARVQVIIDRVIDQVMGFTSDDQKLKFLATHRVSLDAFIGLIAQHLSRNDQAIRNAANTWLRRKGIVLQAQRRYQEALVYGGNPEAIKTFQQLAAVRAGLARLVFAGPGRMGIKFYRQRLAELTALRDDLEVKLSRLSRAYALSQKAGRASVARIARALPAGSVLIEIARIEFYDFKAKDRNKRWLPAHYLVFVIRAGQPKRVGLIDLGAAAKIDAVISTLKRAVASRHLDKQTARQVARVSRGLHDLVFAPLKKYLGPARTIFISPDGQLSQVPFEILVQPGGRFLIEDYTFNYLAAGRDVLRFGRVQGQTTSPLLMGAPDFDLSPLARRLLLDRLGLAAPSRPVPVPAKIKKHPLQSLAQTRQELRAVATLLGPDGCQVHTGPQALKQVLFQARSPRFLHLATHGSFLEDVTPPPGLATRGSGGVALISPVSILARPGAHRRPKALPHRIFNPLLRSRLFLAGANKDGDGILTAEEVLGLRLWGTELVVLSACQTGLGQVKTGEGVFGLQRAFLQAGAKSLVMSLWSVPDLVARRVMVGFYRNFLRRKMDRCQALRQAALAQMRLVRKKYGHAHPLLWAGFVFLGER
jgi:tetratricopeptide (TPR) repeat protein